VALLAGPTSVLAIGAVLLMLGVYYGATDGVLPALASGVIEESERSSGLALLSTVVALSRVAAASGFGLMWDRIGVDRSLIVMGIGLASVIVAVTVIVLLRDPKVEESS